MPRQVSPFPLSFSSVRWVCGILVCLLLAALPHTASADLFYKVEKVIKLTDLNPAASGNIPFSVTGLNNAGRMIGYFPSSNANKLHAFSWDNASHTFSDLNALLAADSSLATCVNDRGTVAGVFWEMGSYAEKGFVCYPDGTVSTFTGPDASHGPVTAVVAINPTDNLVGTYMAVDGTTRAFIVQQSTSGSTIADLGDLGANNAYYSYLWPSALNTVNQVAGNVYLVPRHASSANLTRGFLWDGGMTAIDASLLGRNWTAAGLNDSGQVIGLFDKTAGLDEPFSSAGSYVWDGSSATDLGDLGGGGANAFSIRTNGAVLGTSLNADGALHLFRYGRERLTVTMTDLGSVSVFNGDTSFLPLGISAVTVVDQSVSNDPEQPETLDLAGLGTDANGSARSLLWKDGCIHSVIDLMPAYLSFAAISHDYGSMVFINDSEQIACAGTDASGRQMALLLSIDPDTDNDGLPDSWETHYYGHLGVGKDDPAAGGGGLTNWQAYQQGSDPHDFYNGQQALVAVVSGNGQVAKEGTTLPTPLVVKVTRTNGSTMSNVPVAFTLTQGNGEFASSATGSFSSSITVTTNGAGQATVYFKLPNTTTTVSAIGATSGTAHAAEFRERTFDDSGNAVSSTAPSNFNIVLNADGSTDSTWTNNDGGTEPIPIYVKSPSGEWVLIKTLPAGSTSAHIDESELPW